MESNQDYMDDVENSSENSFQQVYGWFAVTNRVAQNDITKHDVIYKKKLIEVLNQLSYLLDLDKEIEKLHKKALLKG